MQIFRQGVRFPHPAAPGVLLSALLIVSACGGRTPSDKPDDAGADGLTVAMPDASDDLHVADASDAADAKPNVPLSWKERLPIEPVDLRPGPSLPRRRRPSSMRSSNLGRSHPRRARRVAVAPHSLRPCHDRCRTTKPMSAR